MALEDDQRSMLGTHGKKDKDKWYFAQSPWSPPAGSKERLVDCARVARAHNFFVLNQ